MSRSSTLRIILEPVARGLEDGPSNREAKTHDGYIFETIPLAACWGSVDGSLNT